MDAKENSARCRHKKDNKLARTNESCKNGGHFETRRANFRWNGEGRMPGENRDATTGRSLARCCISAECNRRVRVIFMRDYDWQRSLGRRCFVSLAVCGRLVSREGVPGAMRAGERRTELRRRYANYFCEIGLVIE